MRNCLSVIFVFLLSPLFFPGCTTKTKIPQKAYPSETFREFKAAYQVTWNSTINIISRGRGKVIFLDPKNGLVTFFVKTARGKRYMSLFVDPDQSSGQTRVYIRIWHGGVAGDIGKARQFFDDLEQNISKLSKDLTDAH